MAGRDTNSVGKEGRTRQETRNGRAGSEDKAKKKVSFKEEGWERGDSSGLWERWDKEVREIKEERRKFQECIEDWKRKERIWEEKMRKLEERIEGLDKWMKEKVGALEEVREGNGNESRWEGVESAASGENGHRRESMYTSMGSGSSESRLSSIDVNKIKRLVLEKEREERKDNIVFKGVSENFVTGVNGGNEGEKWARNLIRDKLGIECELKNFRKSGPVYIARVEGGDKKKEIMRNKYKLKGGNIFIENDLSWEDRKIQERINKWKKVQKDKGIDVKVGQGRVKIGGIWKSWLEIEKEEEERQNQDRKGRNEKNVENREDTRSEEKSRLSQEGRRLGKVNGQECRARKKLLFWNIAGLGNKDKDFWKYIKRFDFISLSETWLNEEGWTRVRNRLPNSHEWTCNLAEKVKKKGRAKGGFLIGKRKIWGEKWKELMKEKDGVMVTNIDSKGKGRTNIVSVYNGEGWNNLVKKLDEVTEEMDERDTIIIEGDFNIRIGELGGTEGEGLELTRVSKDKVIGNGGRNLIEWIFNKGWFILNG